MAPGLLAANEELVGTQAALGGTVEALPRAGRPPRLADDDPPGRASCRAPPATMVPSARPAGGLLDTLERRLDTATSRLAAMSDGGRDEG